MKFTWDEIYIVNRNKIRFLLKNPFGVGTWAIFSCIFFIFFCEIALIFVVPYLFHQTFHLKNQNRSKNETLFTT